MIRYLRRERTGHTLQPTAVVNEAYLRLIGRQGVDWQDRAHFFAVAAQSMRRIAHPSMAFQTLSTASVGIMRLSIGIFGAGMVTF